MLSRQWSQPTASSTTASSPEMNREQDTAELTGLCSGRLHQAGVTPAAGAARSPDLLPGAAVGGQEAARVVEAGLAQPQLQQRHVAPPAGQLAPALCLACNMPRVTGATCHWSHV